MVLAPQKAMMRAGLAAAMLLIAAGCATVERPPMGDLAMVQELEAQPSPSCGRATLLARHLRYYQDTQSQEVVDRVMQLLVSRSLCEDARIELVGVLQDSRQRDKLRELSTCLQEVDPKESMLADTLAALIIDFSATHDDVMGFIRQHIASSHMPLRYGCVDLLLREFKPDVAVRYGNDIIELLKARVRNESSGAVALLACKALGEMGLARQDRRAEILEELQAVANNTERKYDSAGHGKFIASTSAEQVRGVAVEYDRALRRGTSAW